MPERRRHARVAIDATAVVWREGQGAARYVVRNLSAGGALLEEGPAIAVNELVRIDLLLPDDRHRLSLKGRVVRQLHREGGRAAVAIAFSDVQPHQEDSIQQAVLRMLQALQRPGDPA